jgi:hypothetical protein
MFQDCCALLTHCFGCPPLPEPGESREDLDCDGTVNAPFPVRSQESFTSQRSGSGMASTPGGQSL